MKKLLLTTVLTLLSTLTMWAEDTNYDFTATSGDNTLYYRITNDESTPKQVAVVPEIMPTKYNGFKSYNTKPTGTLTIPATVENGETTYSVTSIGDWALYGCSDLSGSLTIGDNITSIGEYAFKNCSGFDGSLTIGNNVISIGENAFGVCSGFEGTLTIGDNVSSIGMCAFDACSSFSGTLTIGENVETIGNFAFRACSGFDGVTMLRSTPPTIEYLAFENMKDDIEVTVPYYSAVAGKYGIVGSSWQGLTIRVVNYHFTATSGNNTLYYRITDAESTPKQVALVPEFVPTIHNDYKSYTTAPTGTLTIPATVENNETTYSVTSIDAKAFYRCSDLSGSLIIGENVTSIGEEAFYECSGFDGTLTIGDKVETIEDNAFYECTNLSGTLTIPSSVTSIGQYAFYTCIDFTGITMLRTTPPTIERYAFLGMQDDIEVTVPAGTESTYDADTQYIEDLNGDNKWCGIDIALPPTAPVAGESFNVLTDEGYELTYQVNDDGTTATLTGMNKETKAPGADNLVIPATVTKVNSYNVTAIGNDAFDRCDGFTGTLTIGAYVVTIGSDAFYMCSGFTGTLTIPNSVETIGEDAFDDCNRFQGTLTIPSSVVTIGDKAFRKCSGLTGELTIPSSVESIGEWAFEMCFGITNITVASENNNYSSENGILYNYDKSTLICCPTGKTGTATIASNVLNIADNAFIVCNSLDGVTMLCTTPPTVGTNAFIGMKADITVTVPAGTAATYDAHTQYSGDASGDNKWCGMQIEEAISTNINATTPAAAPFTQVGNTLLFSEPTAVSIYNMSGVMMYSGTTKEYTLPQAGIYIIRTNAKTYKVMINAQ